MNLEAWQSMQRAQKEDERKKKQEAERQLQGYRGGVKDEDTKLAQLRDEQRQKKIEAEQRLKGYRGSVSQEDAKLAARREQERQKKLEAERQLRDFRGLAPESAGKTPEKPAVEYPELVVPTHDDPSQTIAAGAVSALADKFKSGSAPIPGMPVNTSTPLKDSGNPQSAVSIETISPESDLSTNFEFVPSQGGTNSGTGGTGGTGAGAGAGDPMNESSGEPIVSGEGSGNLDFTPIPMELGQSEISGFTVSDTSQPNYNPTINAISNETANNAPYTGNTNIDVELYFGVISDQQNQPISYFEGYLSSINTACSQYLTNTPTITFDFPVLKGVRKDETFVDPRGRSTVGRYFVDVALPLSIPSGVNVVQIRDEVLLAIRNFIASGYLQRL